MGKQAKIDSVAALKGFRASVVRFAHAATSAIEELDMQLQRTLIWLQQDRYPYWKARVQQASEAYAQAKIALNQQIVFERAVQGTPSSCIDARKALSKAEQRLSDAQAGLEGVRRWVQEIDRQLNQYRARVNGLKRIIDSEVPRAIARLDRMVDSLQAYIDLAPPEAPLPQAGRTEKQPVQRPAPPGQEQDDTEDMG